MRRALVVANKWWEADPLIYTLSSAKTLPPSLGFIAGDDGAGMRGFIDGGRGRVEVWCLQELMSASVSGSSSEEKARVLPPLLDDEDIALIVAFGTAATVGEETRNGCVVVGTNVFLHDSKVPDSSSHWPIPRENAVVTSALSKSSFTSIAADPGVAGRVKSLGLASPNNPASPAVLANFDFVALADVNVTNYLDYTVADQKVVDAYTASGATQPIGSLETTHGVIRECAPDAVPFMFVSGITDRLGHFNDDVGTSPYQQNFVAAHNAGVAVAAMIPGMLAFLAPD